YMSPEQGAGSGEPDARSDIYSLGCVLFEMLAGHPPFTGATAQEILARHALDPLPSLRAARDAVPEAVERTVRRALAKQPADRFATAAQFAEALSAPSVSARPSRWRRAYAGLGLVALLGGVGAVFHGLLRAPGAPPTEQSLVVLPFVNLSTDSTQEYFSAGMTEELINALSRINGLRVPGRTSSFAYQGKNLPPGKIGQELNVAHVLEGSVRKSGYGLRVSTRLVKVADGYQLWAEAYDRELKDAVAVQEEIARAIVDALQVRLSQPSASPIARKGTESVEAYDRYLLGRFFWNRRTADGMRKAIRYFEEAVQKDSAFALAYSGLADSYVLASQGPFEMSPDEVQARARAAARTALALDPSLAEPHVSLARVHQSYDWDWRAAEQEYERALELDPNNALAHSWYGLFLAIVMGQFDAAILHASTAVGIDPLSPAMNSNLGLVLLQARRYDEAVQYGERAVELSPDWPAAHQNLGRSYLAKGMVAAAIDEEHKALQLGNPAARAWLGRAYAAAGRRGEAVAILRRLEETTGLRRWFNLALVYTALGETDQALRALDQAVESRDFAMGPLLRDPAWDPLRSDPRFARLLTKAGL
ncbi:MAG: tetratricopeptide repeat protein, partial [Gemmatimonadetes bacterium]|nr:tetratricopeptide repeat protein [Gemmatimonadota bacterium]